MDLPTYTNIWRIEKRLYKLYDFRLPAPLPITWIAVFAGITVPYVVFLVAVGLPFDHSLVWLYVLPPGVLTWLTTRPVIESKRLPELISSQLRYLAEPRSWNRMAPATEKDDILVTVRVWHRYPPKPRRKAAKAPKAANAPKAAERGKRATQPSGPRYVGPPSAVPQHAGPQHVRPPVGATAPEAARRAAPAPAHVSPHPVSPATGPLPAVQTHGPVGQPMRVPAGPPVMARHASAPQYGPEAPPVAFRPQVQQPIHPPQIQRPQVQPPPVRPPVTPSRGAPVAGNGVASPRPWPGTPDLDDPSLTEAVDSWFTRQPDLPDAVQPAPARQALPARDVPPREDTPRSGVTDPAQSAEAPRDTPEDSEEAERLESVAADVAALVEDPAPGQAVTSAPLQALPTEPPLPHDAPAKVVTPPAAIAKPERNMDKPERNMDLPLQAPRWLRPVSGTDAPPAVTAERPVIGHWQPRPAPLMPPAPPARPPVIPAPAPLMPTPPADEKPPSAPVEVELTAEPAASPEAAASQPEPTPSEPEPGLAKPEPSRAKTEPSKPQPAPAPSPAGRAALELSHDVPEDVADWFPADILPTSYEPAPPMPRSRRPARDPRPTPPPSPPVPANDSRTVASPPSADTPAPHAATPPAPQPHSAPPQPHPAPHPAPTRQPAPTREPAPAPRQAAAQQPAPAPRQAPVQHQAPAPRPAKVVDLDAERPLPSIERALSAPSSRRDLSWRRRVKVVVGGQGPGKRDQESLDRDRARLPLRTHKAIVVLGCHGGAGQTITALMTARLLASLRGHQVAALDLNASTGKPGTKTSGGNLDIITAAQVSGYVPDFDGLAGHYPLLVIDPAPSGLPRVLDIADQLIIVAPPTPDGASSLANTQQWLEAHGHGDLALRAVTVLNGVTKQTMADVLRAESVARGRCRAIVRVPWDDELKASRPQVPQAPQTRLAYTALAGVVVAGMAAPAPAGTGRSPVEHEG